MASDDYFSQQATQKRINTGQRRQLFLTLHLMLVLAITTFIIFESMRMMQFYSQFFNTSAEALESFWTGSFRPTWVTPLLIMWISLPLHYVWSRSRFSAETMLDREMRENREYELRRYELERDQSRDAAYRLTDDGELFYEPEEIEYELKPKRKRYE